MKVLFIHNRYQHRGGEDTVLDMERSLLESYGHITETLLFDNESITGATGKLSGAFEGDVQPAGCKATQNYSTPF